MKKKYLFMSAAAIMMAGCTSDDLVGDATVSSGETPIAFSMNTPNATRGDNDAAAAAAHTSAASKLSNEFIVWGEKTTGTESGTAATDANLVFKNYRVQYTVSSANTSVSNTNDWEYVGITPYNGNGTAPTSGNGDESTAFVAPSIYTDTNTKQTIKYWDDTADSYTFTAVSAPKDDITSGKVKINKTTSGNYANDKGYTIELASGASVGNIYVADRNVVDKNNGSFSHSVVQMQFRNFQSKIRFGIFETVPGYKVVITGIKYNTNTEKTSTTKGFGVDGNFVLAGAGSGNTNTSYTVTYDANNHAQVAVAAGNTQDYIETSGENWLSTSHSSNSYIGETAAKATYDKTDNAYTAILPNPSNDKNLKLTVKYELYSEDTGEKISVDYTTVEVPAQYCQWKSNYAYTYLFKITDKSADLYPITFDACVVETETGNQETITTVSKPSITTYVKGKTASDEYAGSDVIYAYAQDGTVTKMTSTNMKLYKVTATDGFAITEASVKHALEHTNVTTKVKAEEITSGNDAPSYEAIPREDTGNRTITGMKWTAAAGTTYAIEYIKTTTASGEGSSSTTTKYYKIVKVASGS